MLQQRRAFLKQIALGTIAVSATRRSLPQVVAAGTSSTWHLPRSAPGALGISASGVLDFLAAADKAGHELHSLMIVRHGHVAAEGWWSPYQPDIAHELYSLTKIWISTAVGLAVAEGKLALQDRVLDFFPRQAPAIPSEHVKGMRVLDLLIGATGQARKDITADLGPFGSDQIKAFLAVPVPVQPGTRFDYNPPASMMLSAIVQEATHETLRDYLRPRLFKPLGIDDPLWISGEVSVPFAVRTEDLAKIGLLYLQKGVWDGVRVLSEDWVEKATAAQISTAPWAAEPSNAWHAMNLGYGYQFWRFPRNIYGVEGAFGQFCLVLPDQDAVIVITSEAMHGVPDLVIEWLLPAMSQTVATDGFELEEELRRKLRSLLLPLPQGMAHSSTEERVSGRTFRLGPNDLGAEGLSFDFGRDSCRFSLKGSSGSAEISCGIGKWLGGTTHMPGTPPNLYRQSVIPNLQTLKVAAASAWRNPSTLVMRWQFCETPHHDTVACLFDDDTVQVVFLDSAESAFPPVSTSTIEASTTLSGKIDR